jgi:pseudoazurin
MKPLKKSVALPIMLGLLAAAPAYAADHQVKMLNKDSTGQTMAFEPAFLKIAPGDTVTWVAVDKTHNTESIKTMVPEGAAEWKGKVNEEIKVTFTTEGIYGYKCTPHYPMGMVGVIQVGDSTANLDAVKAVKNPPFAQKRFDAALAQAAGGAPPAP